MNAHQRRSEKRYLRRTYASVIQAFPVGRVVKGAHMIARVADYAWTVTEVRLGRHRPRIGLRSGNVSTSAYPEDLA